MDAELKAKWVAALRSGDYPQAPDALRGGGGFCCLGVLLDVSGLGRWDAHCYVIPREFEPRQLEGDLGLMGDELGVPSELEATLILMNDGKDVWKGNPKSFPEIADYIEANL